VPAAGYALGPQGEICHWLLLGAFTNTPDQEQMYMDHLRPDSTHVPALGLEVNRKEGGKVSWVSHSAPDGTVNFRQVAALGAGTSTAPAIAFAACWLVAENDMAIKFRVNADTGFRLRLDGEQIGNRPKGHEFGKDPETFSRTLTRGTHLIVVKVGTIGGPFGLKFRVTTTASMTERAPHVSVSLGTAPARVLLKETFESGAGLFAGGEVRDDGGQKALEIRSQPVALSNFAFSRVGAGTTVRFRYKASPGIRSLTLNSWGSEHKLNHWYHVRDLKFGEWTPLTVPLKELKGGYNRDGPSLEGDQPANLIFQFDNPEGKLTLLIDDVEITE
jgi:hypothetical protein